MKLGTFFLILLSLFPISPIHRIDVRAHTCHSSHKHSKSHTLQVMGCIVAMRACYILRLHNRCTWVIQRILRYGLWDYEGYTHIYTDIFARELSGNSVKFCTSENPAAQYHPNCTLIHAINYTYTEPCQPYMCVYREIFIVKIFAWSVVFTYVVGGRHL